MSFIIGWFCYLLHNWFDGPESDDVYVTIYCTTPFVRFYVKDTKLKQLLASPDFIKKWQHSGIFSYTVIMHVLIFPSFFLGAFGLQNGI